MSKSGLFGTVVRELTSTFLQLACIPENNWCVLETCKSCISAFYGALCISTLMIKLIMRVPGNCCFWGRWWNHWNEPSVGFSESTEGQLGQGGTQPANDTFFAGKRQDVPVTWQGHFRFPAEYHKIITSIQRKHIAEDQIMMCGRSFIWHISLWIEKISASCYVGNVISNEGKCFCFAYGS